MRFRSNTAGRVGSSVWITAFACLVTVLSSEAAAQPRVAVDYVFLVDVSGSMDGKRGHIQIFPSVKRTITDFLRGLDTGTTVMFIPFAEDVREERRFTFRTPADTAAAVRYVEGLVADGDSTAVYRSIDYALNRLPSLRGGRDHHAALFFVYTDGDDNVSKISLEEILKRFNLVRGKYDWLFYTELGLPRSAVRERQFESKEHTRYVSERAGEVHPLMQIETLLPVLNFGNLLAEPNATRVEKFALRSRQPIPAGFEIAVEPVFDDLRKQGVLAEVRPERVRMDGKQVALRISLTNTASLRHGEYRGKLKLTANDPLVLVVPDEIDAAFVYEAPRTIAVSAPAGQALPFDLGAFSSDKPRPASRQLRLAFSPTARAAQQNVAVELTLSPSNPEPLAIGKDVVVDVLGDRATGVVTATRPEIEISIKPRADLRPGVYSGAIELSSDAQLAGPGLNVDPQTGKRTIDWKFVVEKAPLPAWVWLLGAALVVVAIAAFIAWKRRPPVFGDLQVAILTPAPVDVDLSARHQAQFGKNGEFATEAAEARFVLVAERADDRVRAMLDPIQGEVRIERSGASAMPVVGKEEVYSDDVISFDQYRIQLSSFRLVNI